MAEPLALTGHVKITEYPELMVQTRGNLRGWHLQSGDKITNYFSLSPYKVCGPFLL
jgi:hypothetical protein